MLALAAEAHPEDLIVVLVSGGASSLMEVLVEGVTLEELRHTTDSLLRAGTSIDELNCVRSSLSQLKAGGLARACGRATLAVLLLSDVPGNPREVIGSGPCWGVPPPREEAEAVLIRRKVEIPPGIANALKGTTRLEPASPPHIVLGDVYTALEAASSAAVSLGLQPKVYGRTFSGEAREVGARMAAEVSELQRANAKYDCVIAGGETTVTVRGNGRGGRNQELACAAALALAGTPNVALLSVGTDGTDGPTDAAGGLVDGETFQRTDLRRALEENDSNRALLEANALVVTGPTQSNLNDLVIITRVLEV
jgi:hydroxypyruvate reductase